MTVTPARRRCSLSGGKPTSRGWEWTVSPSQPKLRKRTSRPRFLTASNDSRWPTCWADSTSAPPTKATTSPGSKMKRASGNGWRCAAFVLAEPDLSLSEPERSAPDKETSAASKPASTQWRWMSRALRAAKDSRKSNFGFGDTLTLTPALSHRMGEGESCSVGRRIQPLWNLRATELPVPSPVGRERVRVRVVLLEIRLQSGAYFCVNPKVC